MEGMRRRNPAPIRISIAVTSLLLLVAADARAQSAEAQARFDDGVRLMKAGKTEEACAAFETSNRLEPRAGTLLRLGECRERNRQLASAWSAYQDALTKATDPKKKTFAQSRIKVLEPKLSHLTITVKSRVAGLEIKRDGNPVDSGLWNVAVPIDGGEYAITASASGHIAWSGSATVPVEGGQVSVEVPALAEAPAPPPPPPPKAEPAPKRDEPPPPPRSTWTGKRKVAVVSLTVGVGAAVAGVVLGSSASSKKDDAYKLCPAPSIPCAQAGEANSLISTAHTRALEADVAFGAGAAAAVLAGVLWFTGAPEENVHVEARASARGGGIAIVGRF